jgi:excisionase family DNA binding protein
MINEGNVQNTARSSISPVLTLAEVADYLRVHPSTIYRLAKRKAMPAFKVGHDWRFKLELIDEWRLRITKQAPEQ